VKLEGKEEKLRQFWQCSKGREAKKNPIWQLKLSETEGFVGPDKGFRKTPKTTRDNGTRTGKRMCRGVWLNGGV